MKSDQEPDATTAEPEDSISRSKRILSLVDDYVLRMNSESRTALRIQLSKEFDGARAQGRADLGEDDKHILRAALADYAANRRVIEACKKRANQLWHMFV